MDMCGSSYGSPTLTFSSTLAFQQYGTVLGLEITSENAQTNSIDVKKYEAIYGIAGIHGNYPAPPGVRSSMVLGSPATGRTAYNQIEGNSAGSGIQIRTIEACCTPANYVGALTIIFSDNSRKKMGSQQCNKSYVTVTAPANGQLASFRIWMGTQPAPTAPVTSPTIPGTAQPAASQPGAAVAGASQPTAAIAGASEPAASQSAAAFTGAAEPRAAQPRAAQPAASQPAAAFSGTAQPRAAQPRASQSAPAFSGTAQPRAAFPQASQPTASQTWTAVAGAAEPTTAEPRAAFPRASQPAAAFSCSAFAGATSATVTTTAFSCAPFSRAAVMYGTRYGTGRVVGTAAKSITDLCCKAGSDPNMDLLLMRQALWAAAYGIKLGGAKVRVSDPAYIPFAQWLVATAATLKTTDKNGCDAAANHRANWLKAPPNGVGNNPEWYLPVDVFTAQYNDPRSNKPGSFVVDLYIIGPDNDLYNNYEVNRTFHSYVYNSSRGLFVIGPDMSHYDALWNTAAWASVNQTGLVVRRHRRQLHGGLLAASGDAWAAGDEQHARAAALDALRLSAGMLLEAQGRDEERDPAVAQADPTRFHMLEDLTRRYQLLQQQARRRRLASYTVNTLLGPMGITYVPTPLPALSTVTVSFNTLTNCQQASIIYIYYLQGKLALGPADLDVAVKTISIARGSYSLSDPWASQYFWPYQDDIQFYGGVIPNQPPPSPPPPPTTSPTLSPVNCYKDNSNARALPYRLGGSSVMTNVLCNSMAKSAGFPYMGTQGTNCWAGYDLNLCGTYGTASGQCTTRCPGNTATFCGNTATSPFLLSVFKVV
ncbi:hypothetical protein HYH02_004543 [Chlamydomonas schloesseri]|uniref:WSC domain-containing protein n=1 Tax=Chlamydomonas schloesseri TaxID=2026947 RepID=A0A835WQ93_9CHLO|nr:hypothetical protein HYH02_004543 [Chlamydomonas schloesseri]|eukprot:KAG2450705.1 hypothetical protein HYH02_004543 [Chlamydomonas schloesseri]